MLFELQDGHNKRVLAFMLHASQ